MPRELVLIVAIGSVLAIVTPISVALARRVQRGGRPVDELANRDIELSNQDVALRLGRLEQAVDTVAIEVERISESQRFMTRMLNDRLPRGEPVP